MSSDVQARERFCTEIEKNFSVIAPAGVGKTRAIIDRVVTIAEKDPRSLASLVVVTYTKKAAEEMFDRAKSTLAHQKKEGIFSHFLGKSFFGTIHSFCFQLIQRFGSALNLPKDLSIIDSDDTLRLSFLREEPFVNCLANESLKTLLRFVDIEHLVGLSLEGPFPLDRVSLGTCPPVSENSIVGFTPNERNHESVSAFQNLFQDWTRRLKEENTFLPLPICEKGEQTFKAIWRETFAPLRCWLEQAALLFAQEFSTAYLNFRIEKGLLLHEDTITLAKCLLTKEKVRSFLKKQPISILLDEAQDTDASQFDFLLELFSLHTKNRFSMVGDPQQSIYGSRTQVASYLKQHRRLIAENRAEFLVLNTTFRCSRSVVNLVNECFPRLLVETVDKAQVNFVPLFPTSTAAEGRVFRVCLKKTAVEPENESLEQELRGLVRWLKAFAERQSIKNASISLLCPRNQWLHQLERSFSQENLRLQIYSTKQLWRNQPLYAWLCSLIRIMAFPEDSFEIAGFLRGCWGIREDTLTEFVRRHEATIAKNDLCHALQILRPSNCVEDEEVSQALSQLYQLRKTIFSLTLVKGVRFLISSSGLVERLMRENRSNEEGFSLILQFIEWQAIVEESKSNCWQTFSKTLCQQLSKPFMLQSELDPNAFQGYSCHKSKGLEWPIVVLPFFFRPIEPRPPKYPYFRNGRVVIDAQSDSKIDLKRYNECELERLLYVSCTRAKQTLIFVDDSDLWRERAKTMNPSFGDLFLKSKTNHDYWNTLPVEQL